MALGCSRGKLLSDFMYREDYTSAVGELALLIRKGYGKGMDKGVEAAMVNDVRLAVTIIERCVANWDSLLSKSFEYLFLPAWRPSQTFTLQ